MPIFTSSARSTIAYSVSYATTQNRLTASTTHAIGGTASCTAAYAIGMPNENATPRNSCGTAKKRLKNGYATAIASAGADHGIAARLSNSTSRNAANAPTPATT